MKYLKKFNENKQHYLTPNIIQFEVDLVDKNTIDKFKKSTQINGYYLIVTMMKNMFL